MSLSLKIVIYWEEKLALKLTVVFKSLPLEIVNTDSVILPKNDDGTKEIS